MAGNSLSVVIPTYNERENIKVLVPRILEVFEENTIDGEIVIVEDQSSDGSEEVLKDLQSKHECVTVLFRSPPNSIARAWVEGFTRASKENIVCIDADLCHNPKYFPVMLEKMVHHDIVIGSRYLTNRMEMMEDKSFIPVYLSVISQFLTRIVLRYKESDISHSFRMFKKDLFLKIKAELTQEGNVFLIEFLYLAKKQNARITEIPIEYGKRIYGETKLKVSKEGFRYLRFILSVFCRHLLGLEK